jgi:protein phosphatase inhibitor 2
VFADSDEEAMDEEAKAHKRDFEKKRAMHYGQEAALALQRAKEMAEDEEEEDANATPPPMPNGSNGGL